MAGSLTQYAGQHTSAIPRHWGRLVERVQGWRVELGLRAQSACRLDTLQPSGLGLECLCVLLPCGPLFCALLSCSLRVLGVFRGLGFCFWFCFSDFLAKKKKDWFCLHCLQENGASVILRDIARARENIQKSLAGVSTHGPCTRGLMLGQTACLIFPLSAVDFGPLEQSQGTVCAKASGPRLPQKRSCSRSAPFPASLSVMFFCRVCTSGACHRGRCFLLAPC